MATNSLSRLALVSITTVLVACGSGNDTSQQHALHTLSNQNLAVYSEQARAPLHNDMRVEAEGCALSILDETLMAAVNTARAEARWCGDRWYEAAPAVSWQCELEEAATLHATDMGDNNFFSHIGSDGLRVSHRVDRTGYDWSMVGENIAAGYTRVESVMHGWLESPGHCGTLMNPDYVHLANAVYVPSDALYTTYWTLVMAKPL